MDQVEVCCSQIDVTSKNNELQLNITQMLLEVLAKNKVCYSTLMLDSFNQQLRKICSNFFVTLRGQMKISDVISILLREYRKNRLRLSQYDKDQQLLQQQTFELNIEVTNLKQALSDTQYSNAQNLTQLMQTLKEVGQQLDLQKTDNAQLVQKFEEILFDKDQTVPIEAFQVVQKQRNDLQEQLSEFKAQENTITSLNQRVLFLQEQAEIMNVEKQKLISEIYQLRLLQGVQKCDKQSQTNQQKQKQIATFRILNSVGKQVTTVKGKAEHNQNLDSDLSHLNTQSDKDKLLSHNTYSIETSDQAIQCTNDYSTIPGSNCNQYTQTTYVVIISEQTAQNQQHQLDSQFLQVQKYLPVQFQKTIKQSFTVGLKFNSSSLHITGLDSAKSALKNIIRSSTQDASSQLFHQSGCSVNLTNQKEAEPQLLQTTVKDDTSFRTHENLDSTENSTFTGDNQNQISMQQVDMNIQSASLQLVNRNETTITQSLDLIQNQIPQISDNLCSNNNKNYNSPRDRTEKDSDCIESLAQSFAKFSLGRKASPLRVQQKYEICVQQRPQSPSRYLPNLSLVVKDARSSANMQQPYQNQ